MLAWTKQNTMQRVIRTVLESQQSHATSKTINMISNKYEPQQMCRRYFGMLFSRHSLSLFFSQTNLETSLEFSVSPTRKNAFPMSATNAILFKGIRSKIPVRSCSMTELFYKNSLRLLFSFFVLVDASYTASLVFNPITVNNFASLFNCTPVGRASDSMMAPT